MDLGLKDKRAVVTGADSGMGFATAKLLLAEGARVLLADKDRALLDTALAELGDQEAYGAVVDVRDTTSVGALKSSATEKLGGVDILVHAAGVAGATGDFHEIGDDGWLETLNVNLMGTVRVVRAFAPDLAKAGHGRVVLFASEDGLQPYPDELPYCASKAAIINLAKGLSKAYAKDGVLVNAVSPAFIASPMTDAMMTKRAGKLGVGFDEAIASFLDEERPTLELKRRGEAEEAAAAVLFLCSARASFITGSNLRVDGGSVASI